MSALEESLLQWLKTQGYPLEFRTAAAFQEEGFEVTQSEYYVDPKTDSPREIDVVAQQGRISDTKNILFMLSIAVECKSSAAPKGVESKSGNPKPWVLLTQAKPSVRTTKIMHTRIANAGGKAWLGLMDDSHHAIGNSILAADGRLGFGLIRARTEQRENYDPSYQALHACVNAATDLIKDAEQIVLSENEVIIHIAVPIVVVSDPLFACSMDTDGTLKLERIDKGDLLWRYPVAGSRMTPVKVVAESHIADYAKQLNAEVHSIMRTLPDHGRLRELENRHRANAPGVPWAVWG